MNEMRLINLLFFLFFVLFVLVLHHPYRLNPRFIAELNTTTQYTKPSTNGEQQMR